MLLSLVNQLRERSVDLLHSGFRHALKLPRESELPVLIADPHSQNHHSYYIRASHLTPCLSGALRTSLNHSYTITLSLDFPPPRFPRLQSNTPPRVGCGSGGQGLHILQIPIWAQGLRVTQVFADCPSTRLSRLLCTPSLLGWLSLVGA